MLIIIIAPIHIETLFEPSKAVSLQVNLEKRIDPLQMCQNSNIWERQ
jgi:hypothetical protein